MADRAANEDIKVGDTVVVKAMEPLSMTSSWDPHYVVTQVRGKVVWLHNQQTGKRKTLNVNKVKLVDPDICWDEIRPRPTRDTRVSTKLRGVRARSDVIPSANQSAQAPERREEPMDVSPSPQPRVVRN